MHHVDICYYCYTGPIYSTFTGGGGGGGGGGGRGQFCCNLTVDSDQFEANVTDLQPETAYIFSVGYASRGFRSDLSKEQTLMTTDSESYEYLICLSTLRGGTLKCEQV